MRSNERVADELRGDVAGGTAKCVFCNRIASPDIVAESQLAVAVWDAFPLSPGHVLVVPRRHEADFFLLSEEERTAMVALLCQVKEFIDSTKHPAGYNVGLNIGQAAGQTIPHAHLHLIPRYVGDLADPRGGIRWVLPERAAYWK